MTSLVNAAPRLIFNGIDDQSRGTLVREPETYPQHMPLLRLFTETGPEETTLVSSDSGGFTRIFGSQSLNRRSKYFNTQTLLAETLLAEGNSFFVKRLRPDDAGNPARIILAIDMVADDIPKVTNLLAGFDYPDLVNDDMIVDQSGEPETVAGVRARLVLIENNTQAVGTMSAMPGSFVSNRDGTQSTLYPLMELPASFFGAGGNLLGMRMWAPTTDDNLPFDEATADAFGTRMYRIQFLRKDRPSASPVVVKTILDETFVDVCFTPGTYSASSDREFYIGDMLINSYQDDGITSGTTPVYSPFSKVHVYHSYLEQVLQKLYDAEMEINPAAATHIQGPGQMNPFTGVDVDGDRHHALLLEGPLQGGIRLGKETSIFATGGADGTTDLEEYEKLVNRENLNFGELDDNYQNLAHYPFGVLYDTGLSMDGKYQMMEVLGRRSDLRTIFTTFVEAEGRLPTISEEVSRTQALMARLRAHPESTLYGTPVCRAEIILQGGYLAQGGYTKPVPQVIDYAQRWARMAGAGNGSLRSNANIDVSPNNRVTMLKDFNVQFFNERVQSNLWANGATYSLSYDRRSQYYPALHSVYSDDTSVLISPITVSICCDIIRLIRIVHAEFSGNATLTRAQLIERCNARILELTDGRYSDRVNIIPETYFTAADEARGFSWHCRVTVEANNPFNVMIFDLVTQRTDTLGQ